MISHCFYYTMSLLLHVTLNYNNGKEPELFIRFAVALSVSTIAIVGCIKQNKPMIFPQVIS